MAEALRADADADAERSAVRLRDRRIGRELAGLADRPTAQALGWLASCESAGVHVEAAARGRRASAAQQLAITALAVVGLLVGVGASAAVFYYDGTRPVNVVQVLAWFVFVPVGLLVLTGVGMLPPAWLARVPGARAVQGWLSLLSPGRWPAAVVAMLPQGARQAGEAWLGRGRAHAWVFGRLQRWVVLLAAQWFAVAFYAGAIGWFGYLIVFSDLAFAWSTTLRVEPGQMHRLTEALSWPWASWWPAAAPSEELVRATRYFRIDAGVLPEAGGFGDAPQRLGDWWPFLMAAMTAYGLVPRVVTLVVAWQRYRAALRWTAVHLPGMTELRDRLNHELVETGATTAEIGDEATGPVTAVGQATAVGRCVVVNWSGVPLSDEALAQRVRAALGSEVEAVRHAGGARSVEQDAAVVEAVGGAAEKGGGERGAGSIVVAVKGWEPPILELVDFVEQLRGAVGRGVPIVVAPLMSGDGMDAERGLSAWRKKLAAVGDPWLSVRPLRGEAERV